MDIRLHILEEITDGFSVHSIIGTGGSGNVYKGVYNGREIAVKLLHVDTVQGLDDRKFNNEVGNLLRVKHPHIVQLLGYCYETQSKYVEHNGEKVFSKHIYRALCFEYLQGGSLDKHLCAQSFAPKWSTRYNIMKGICEGLNFLHECEPPILHLDLKPANILLDSSMVSKVADFGLSRLFTRSHTQVTERIVGTQKYMPPEFIKDGKISPKNDVFSLGVVMIEIMAGSSGYSSYIEMDDVTQFVQRVLTNWSTVIGATSMYRLEEIDQVTTCIGLAIKCVDSERNNRPTTADILHALNKTEVNIPKRQVADILLHPAIGPKNTVDNPLKTMIDELENITNKDQHSNFRAKDSFNSNVQQVTDIRETSSDVEEELIMGRTEEKKEIVATLSGSITREFTVLPIYGIGGIGKTTLAQLVFNDSQFADYSRVWVYVSQNLDLHRIGNSIISQLSNSKERHLAEKQMIHNRLRNLLAGKKILIVLDDVWEENPNSLESLNAMLRLGLGSTVKIIVTTRDEAIAREVCYAVEPYKVQTFSDKICWKIIKQKAAFKGRVDKKQLKHIGKEIATKCGGVALAAQSLGYMLKHMKYSGEWESVRDSYIWNPSTPEGSSSRNHEVLASLMLSYSHMHVWLKLCFSYCAVFPKGHLIAKYDLIHQWIALGFTEQSSTFDSMQLCEKYVAQLLGMSFLQYSKIPTTDGQQAKDATMLTMHDLVHDLARVILADQVNDKGNVGGNRCRYAQLTDCTKPLQFSVTSPANIRALHFLDCRGLELCGDAFLQAICLRVLDLSECIIQSLPDSIGQLNQLRYIRAPGIQGQIIPSCITKFSELNYLNLRGSRNISALPESIGDMKGLMHLDLSGCTRIYELPMSFAELKQLVHLDLSYCKIFISEAFGGFTQLQYLNLSKNRSGLNRRGLPKVIGNLIKLRHLYLSDCIKIISPDHIDILLGSISNLPNLEELNMSGNPLYSLPESMGNLRKLHTLDLSYCIHLEKLPDSMVNMVSLKVLGLHSFRLDAPVLSQLNVASLPHFVVRADNDKCSSNIILLQPTNPVELMIDRLENVKSAEEAQRIKLIEKQKIEVLRFQWTVDAVRIVDDKEVLEKLVPPRSVRTLYMNGYWSVNFPDWIMGMSQYLPNLSIIDFCNMDNTILPPLGELPNLTDLCLSYMKSLEEWITTYTSGNEGVNELFFPKLETLTIKHCTKLRIKPCLPRAMSLGIEDSDNVLSSWCESSSQCGASSSSPLTELWVHESKLPLHEWRLLHQLPALRILSISDCSDLTASPEIIQHLSSLQSLSIGSIKEQELPRWLVNMTSLQEQELSESESMALLLTYLKSIKIEYCKGITSLLDSIQQLTKLEYLSIDDCSALQEWCESEENMKKLAHIREKIFPRPRFAKPHEEDISETFVETTNNIDTASGSNVDNRGKKPVNIEETIDLINMKDVGGNLQASISGTVTGEEHPDLVSTVMNMPGFPEEVLLVALSHLRNNDAQGSAYIAMQEEERVSWLVNFLKRHY